MDNCQIPDCVDPFDASLVLRYLACRDYLMACPFPHMGGVVYPQQVARGVYFCCMETGGCRATEKIVYMK